MLESLFNIWIWLLFAVFAGSMLLIAYLKYGPDEHYEPYEHRYEGIVETIHVEDRYKHIKFRKINGVWYPRINLRDEAFQEAKYLILFLMLPCTLILSHQMNQVDHIEPDGTIIYKVKN